MKERYETPEMEIVEFETEDIITTSGNECSHQWVLILHKRIML